jgi:hypothetical protein
MLLNAVKCPICCCHVLGYRCCLQEKLRRAEALASEREALTNHLRRTLEQQDLRVKQVRQQLGCQAVFFMSMWRVLEVIMCAMISKCIPLRVACL